MVVPVNIMALLGNSRLEVSISQELMAQVDATGGQNNFWLRMAISGDVPDGADPGAFLKETYSELSDIVIEKAHDHKGKLEDKFRQEMEYLEYNQEGVYQNVAGGPAW